MASFNRIEAGREAEQRACEYLRTQGLSLIAQNYRCYHGELDLIMRDNNVIVFVEVRKRGRTDYGNAFDSVNGGKQQKLVRTATHFLQKHNWLYKVNSRFDVVAIHPVKGSMQLQWIKNAFTVDDYRG